MLKLAEAARRARGVTARYTSYNGATTDRELSPYGVVVHQGRWYLAAYDHGREDLRTFRVDRMERVTIGGEGRPADAGFDATEHVLRSFAQVPWTHEVVVDLAEPREVPLADVTPEGRLTMRVESLDYMARVLASLGCEFAIVRPAELNEAVQRLSDLLGRAAASTPPR